MVKIDFSIALQRPASDGEISQKPSRLTLQRTLPEWNQYVANMIYKFSYCKMVIYSSLDAATRPSWRYYQEK